jgi:PAS domain S-box-containing protein
MAPRSRAPSPRGRPRAKGFGRAAASGARLTARLRVASASACRLAGEPDLQRLLDGVARDTLTLFDAAFSVIRLLEPDQSLRRAASAGSPAEVNPVPAMFPASAGVSGVALERRAVVRYQKYADVPRNLAAGARAVDWGPSMGTPLLVAERPLGTLVIVRPLGARPFDETDETVLRLFTAHVAVAVDKARTLAALAASEARYRTSAEEALDLVYSTDPEGRVVYVNHRIEDLTGYTPAEVVGQPWRSRLTPESQEALEIRHDRIAAGWTPSPLFEVELQHRTGEPVPVEVQVALLHAEGRLVGRIGVARDLRPRRRAEAERLAAARRAALLEGAVQTARATAHAINDSLARLAGETNLLLARVSDDHPLQDRLQAIANAAEDIAQAIQQFQAVARFESIQVAPDLPPMLDLSRATGSAAARQGADVAKGE